MSDNKNQTHRIERQYSYIWIYTIIQLLYNILPPFVIDVIAYTWIFRTNTWFYVFWKNILFT